MFKKIKKAFIGFSLKTVFKTLLQKIGRAIINNKALLQKIILLVVFLSVVIGLFIVLMIVNRVTDNSVEERVAYEKNMLKLNVIDRNIEIRMLNQKADMLHIPRFHLKNESIRNYAHTSLNKGSILLFQDSKKKQRLYQDSLAVAIYTDTKTFYLYKNRIVELSK